MELAKRASTMMDVRVSNAAIDYKHVKERFDALMKYAL